MTKQKAEEQKEQKADEQKLNEAFRIPVEQLEDVVRAKLNGASPEYDFVIPLRNIVKVEEIQLFRTNVVDRLIRHIPLRGPLESQVKYPYKDSEIKIYGREPKGFYLGQRFVLTRKVLGIMQGLNLGIFKDFETRGVSKMPPVRVYGYDSGGKRVVGLYIPPIIELHDNYAILIDGIHRSYVCMAAGTTINAVHISHVAAPLPFRRTSWEHAPLVEKKPDIEHRYFDLRKDLFRDLRRVGIDG